MDDPTVEQKAEALARRAAERAAELALSVGERAQKIAVDRAVKDAMVDRDLRDHASHLAQINGSQRDMATSLGALQTSFEQMSVANAAVAKYVTERSGRKFSSRTLIIGALAGLGAYVGLFAVVLGH